MGGRGAGSNLGNGNSDSISYSKYADVWSYRHQKNNEAYVDNINQTVREMGEQYKDLDGFMNDFFIAKIDGGSNAMAFWSPSTGELAINKTYANVKKMQSAYDACVKAGFHPARGNKTAEQAVVAHELGHTLTSLIQNKTGSKSFDITAKSIMTDAQKALGGKRGTTAIAKKISGYATDSNAECIAEATADVYCNGKNAKAESKAIVNAMKKYL